MDDHLSKYLFFVGLFSSPITITDRVKPVCLPETSLMMERNSVCFLTAFGKTEGKAYAVGLKIKGDS